MELQRELPIELALFLTERSPEPSGRALWAALCEVAEFFGGAEERLRVPIGRSDDVVNVLPTFRKTILAPQRLDGLPSQPDAEEFATSNYAAVHRGLTNVDSLGRINHAELGTLLRSMLESNDIVVVVTDCEIAPPTHLRYLIWDVFFNGAVVSTAPTSPRYWGQWDSAHGDDVRAMKWRTRAACLGVVGSLLGMTRCLNERCYLFQNLDAVSRLDHMTCIGDEHAVAGLSGYGFPDVGSPPSEIAPKEKLASEPKAVRRR